MVRVKASISISITSVVIWSVLATSVAHVVSTTAESDDISENRTDVIATNVSIPSRTVADIPPVTKQPDGDEEWIYDPVSQAKAFENGWKKLFKQGVKWLLPRIMDFGEGSALSGKCTRDLIKYLGALTNAKVWAAKMFDATSKPPAGIFEGTFSDFGSFDQCLDIMVPLKNGSVDFQGAYCAIEARPFLPPIPKNFSLALQYHAKPTDSIAKEVLLAGRVLFYLSFRFGVCVPSSCSVEDMNNIVGKVGAKAKWRIHVPKCYMKEEVSLNRIHIAVISVVLLLLVICLVGTGVEYFRPNTDGKSNNIAENILLAFSLRSNFNKLVSKPKSTNEMKALHGIRGLSMAWVLLGHTYVWANFQLLRRPYTLQLWFNQLQFEAILNAWLSVEPFFFLSGFLTCYGCIQLMEKTKGKLNIALFIIRRYIRLMPTLLMVMGMIFFLPLISSGPFWYDRIDPELQSCQSNWWTSILFISNWYSVKSICIHPTWFLSADFQLHILSLLVLFPLYRSLKLGALVMSLAVVAATFAVAVLTYFLELPPIVQIASGNDEQIIETLDKIHIRSFTHVGPYVIGMATGYILLKYKHIKIGRIMCSAAWCASFAVCIASLYGAHTWNTGHPHGAFLTSVYAATHRTTFIIGIAWVAFACVTGHGGPVNKFLSSSVLVPLSRLTFCIYLTQSLVIWTRKASERERSYYSHYNHLYEFVGNAVGSVLLAIPLHLLVEAPVSNLDRLLFTNLGGSKGRRESAKEETQNRNVSVSNGSSKSGVRARNSFDRSVELNSVETRQTSHPR